MRKLNQMTLAVVAALMASTAAAAPLLTAPLETTQDRAASPAANAAQRGLKAIEAGDLAGAERAMRDAIKLDPKAPEGYIGMAEVAARRQKPAEVESWLKQALQVDPGGAQTLRVWGRWQYRQKRYGDAEAAFKKAVAAAPDSIDARLDLGEVQLRGLKNPKAAEATYRAAVERNASHVGARLALAAALVAQGREAAAVGAFEDAARLEPSNPTPLLALARYQASRAKVDAALATLDRLIAAIPTAGQAYLDRGDLLLLKSDVPGAMDAYRSGIKAAPGTSAAVGHVRLGTLYEAQQNWAEAEREYRAAIALAPKYAVPYNNLAFMLAARGKQLDEAQQLADKAVELAPKSATMLDTQGWVYRARGKLDPAFKSISRAVALQPRHATFHYHLGVVQSEQGRNADAQSSFKRALEIDPKFRSADDTRQRLQRLATSG